MPLPPDGRRAGDARATRTAILAAARTLFAEQGFFATRVEEIARRAGVAPATVYAVTGGKQGLMAALVETWSTTPSVERSLEGVARGRRVQDVLTELAAGVRRVREDWGDVIDVVLATAPHDRTVADSLARARGRYRAAIRTTARRVVDLSGGGADEDVVTEVADVLWFLFGFRGWSTLVQDAGWEPARAEAWLVAQAHHAVGEVLSGTSATTTPLTGSTTSAPTDGARAPELEQ